VSRRSRLHRLCACQSSSSRDSRLQLAGLLDGDGLGGLSGLRSDALDGLDDVKALDDLSEDNVLAVQPGGLHGADEKLGAVAESLLALGQKWISFVTYVPGPALAMERIPGPVCLRLKFSSSNFSP
jgi:hypothetical protein